MIKTIFYSLTALIWEILFLPLKLKIQIIQFYFMYKVLKESHMIYLWDIVVDHNVGFSILC